MGLAEMAKMISVEDQILASCTRAARSQARVHRISMRSIWPTPARAKKGRPSDHSVAALR
jgi:hypothetical protein